MNYVAVIGNKETVLIFKTLGVAVFEAETDKEVEILNKVLNEKFQIVFMTEDIFKKCKEVINKHIYNPNTVITVIPNAGENKGIGIKELRQATIDAISTDILGN
jgi:V/A-type H+/Na+-transporting ATPase subunit F